MFMTIEEIDSKYNGEWVYIINLQTNGTVVLGGEIAAHNPCRANVIQVMLESDSDSIYIKYAGNIPEGVSVLL